MNWLDTQTKALLQKTDPPQSAPPKTSEFSLVLLRKGEDQRWLTRAIAEIRECVPAEAEAFALREPPVIVQSDLTEEDALWGQFELLCTNSISVFLRSEIVAHGDASYLHALFADLAASEDFDPTTVVVKSVPQTESGHKFLRQFLGDTRDPTDTRWYLERTYPIPLTVPFKKAWIMQHWAGRIGAVVE